MEENNKSSMGGIVGTIIIIALIVLGGLYFWGKQLKESRSLENLGTEETSEMTTDELNTMESDLQSADLDNLDAELKEEVQ